MKFIKIFLLLSLPIFLPAFSLCASLPLLVVPDDLTLLVGTYTEASISKGIVAFRFNQQTGKVVKMSETSIGNPSFIAVAPGSGFVYSVSEYNEGRQAVNSFKFDKILGQLTFLNTQLIFGGSRGGEDPCYIWTNGQHVVTADYTGGSVSVFPVAANGFLYPASQHFQYSGVCKGSVAHIHCVQQTPDSNYLLATDLGNDRIYRFKLNFQSTVQNKEDFLVEDSVVYKGPLGWGPRHFIFNKRGDLMYLINELGGYIVSFKYKDGQLMLLQTLKADKADGHGSADIHLSPDGKFLYVSHRLKNDGISIFKVDERGMLTRIGYQNTGIHPRNFNITPNGLYLLVACRDDNYIQIFKRNIHSGLLMDTGQKIRLGKPVCICWAL